MFTKTPTLTPVLVLDAVFVQWGYSFTCVIVSGDQGTFAVHSSLGHENLEGCVSKSQQGQQIIFSKGKCEVSQAVPYNSSVSEAKKYTKSSPKFIGVRRTSSQYYTTIGEYFGKGFIKTTNDKHDIKDHAKREKEFTSNKQKLVYENKLSPLSMNDGGLNQVMKTKNLPTKDVILPVSMRNELDKVAVHQHKNYTLQSIKRRSSEDSQLLSKIDVKRRCSYGGEEAAALGVSVDKGSKMRPMGNDMKSKKSEEKIHKTEELPKRVSHVSVHRLSTDKGMTEVLKIRKEEGVLEKESPYCSAVGMNSAQGASIERGEKESSVLLLKGKKRRNASEDITNTDLLHVPELDLKCMKYKKRKRLFELFGEDPDESSGKKTYNPDRVGMKVLQASSNSTAVSDCVDEYATLTVTSEQDTIQKEEKHESETSSFIKATVRHSGKNKTKESVDQQSTSSCHEEGIQKEDTEKSTQFIVSVQHSNCSEQAVCGSIKNTASDAALRQNDGQESCVTSSRNILHQKDNECGGGCELGSSVTPTMKEGTDLGTVALDDRLKDHESSNLTHKSDIHLTGSIEEGERGEFHLIINVGNTDSLFPGPEKGQSDTGVKLLASVDCSVAKDVNEASSGHSANTDELVSAEQCIENADVPLNTVERVVEEMVASAGGRENVSLMNIPKVVVLCREETGSGGTHVSPVPHSACAEQNPPGNHHRTVMSSRSEPHVNSLQSGRKSSADFASESQVLNMSAITERIQDHTLDVYADSGSSQSLPEEGSKEMEIRKEKGTGKGIVNNEDIQRKSDTAGKSKCLSESNAVLMVASSKESCNISPAAVDHKQSDSCSALETNISNSGEPSSSAGSQSSVRSDQLPNRLLDDNSVITNLSQSVTSPPTSRGTNNITDVVGVPASYTSPRIRVRDPESLGITRPLEEVTSPQFPFFEVMDTKLRELTEVTYVLLQDLARFKQRCEAVSYLTGSLRVTERDLAMAEFSNPHQIMKIKTFLSLYDYIEKIYPHEIEDFLINRLNVLNPGQIYTSELVKKCRSYCILVDGKSVNNVENACPVSNVENSCHNSGQATVSSFPYQQQYQQQPVGVPLPDNVSGNANSLLATSSEGGRLTSLSSEGNLNSKQQSFTSGERVASVAQIQHTAGRKTVINTAGVTKPPPSYDMHVREAGTNLNTRHIQARNMLHQHPMYNPLQAQNASSKLQTHPNYNPRVPKLVPADNRTIPPNPYVPQTVPAAGRTFPPSPYIPHSVPATDRIIPLAQVPVSNTPYQTTIVNRLLPHAYKEQSTVHHAATNSIVSHGSGRAVAGFTSGYSQPSVLIHSYSPNQHGSSSFNTPNALYSQNRITQQRTSTQHNNNNNCQNANPRITYPNGSTQVGSILNVVNQNTVSNKSALHSFSQPYSQSRAEQQDTFSQAVRNTGPHTFTATGFNQHYPRNAVQQGTFPHVNNVFPVASVSDSYSYLYSRSEPVRQGAFSHPVSSSMSGMSTYNISSQPYVSNVAVSDLVRAAPVPSGYPNQQNKANTYNLFNDFPSSSLTGRAQNVSLIARPTREIYGSAHQTGNRFHSLSSYPAQLPSHPQHLRQLLLQPAQQVTVGRGNGGYEHHAYDGQGNGEAYHRVACGLPQQQQAPAGASVSELQSYGIPQCVSNRRRSHGKGNANVTGSSNFCDGRNTQNVPTGGGISYRGNNQSRYLGNSTASLSLTDKENSEGLSLASTAASDRVSDGGSAQSEPASSNVSDRGYSESLSSASTAASDRPSDGGSAQSEAASSNLFRRENNCVSVANSTETSSLSDTGNNHRSGFFANSTTKNSVFDSGSNKTPPLTSTTINDSVCDRGSNQSGPFLNSAAGDGFSGGGSSHSGPPPPVVDTSSSVPLQARLKGVNQQSNSLTEKTPANDAGKHTMSSVTQDDISGATSTPSTESRGIEFKSGLIESYSISEATPVQNPQLERHSNITVSSVSQTESSGIQHSSQQRQLSGIVSTQPVLTNSTAVVAVQASENQDVPGVSRQENGMSSTRHSVQQTLDLHGCELLTTHHVTHTAAESEPPEKTVQGDRSTRDTLTTGNHDKATLRTDRKKISEAKSRSQSEKVEVLGHTNDVQVENEVGGVQDAHIVENVVGSQGKSGVESGILQKCLSSSYSSDHGTGVGSDVAGEEGNSNSSKVLSRLLEEREVMIVTDFVRIPMSTAQSYQLSASLNNISADTTEASTRLENNREHEPEIEVVSCMLILSHL